MSAMKDITQRISNVSTTGQIIKAMDMIAASKLQRVRARLGYARPLYEQAREMIESLTKSQSAAQNIYFKPRKVKGSAYIILTSDKGLCGGYNINVSEMALKHMDGKNEQLFIIGAKGAEYFKRRNKNIKNAIINQSEALIYSETELVAKLAASLFVSGEADEVFVAYTKFESTLNYLPAVEQVLPLSDGKGSDISMKYEPDANTFLTHAVPVYLHSYLYAAAVESIASEYASRMINMNSAAKNADEIISDLNRMYNRKRQAAITQELSEIVGGVNIFEEV